jgi:putative addiction module component (TIGR02574 family)
MLAHQQLFEDIFALPPIEKIDLVERILASLDREDKEIDTLWSQEAENRLNAYHAGKMKSIPLEQIVSKYKHHGH